MKCAYVMIVHLSIHLRSPTLPRDRLRETDHVTQPHVAEDVGEVPGLRDDLGACRYSWSQLARGIDPFQSDPRRVEVVEILVGGQQCKTQHAGGGCNPEVVLAH